MSALNGLRIVWGNNDKDVYTIVYCDHVKKEGFKYQAYNRDMSRLWFNALTDDEVRTEFSTNRVKLA